MSSRCSSRVSMRFGLGSSVEEEDEEEEEEEEKDDLIAAAAVGVEADSEAMQRVRENFDYEELESAR